MKGISTYSPILPSFRSIFRNEPMEAMDKFFGDEFFQNFGRHVPAIDVREEDGRYLIEAELPGMTDKDVKLEVKDGILTIASAKENDSKDIRNETSDGSRWVQRERRSYSFSRSFELPENANLELIEARFKDGLLTIMLPKKPEEAPKTIPVKTE